MYYDFYGLKQPPFKITPDTSLFFPGGERGAILDALIYAIVSGEGIVKLVGEVGSGKTTLCRMLEKELPDKVEIVYLANPSLSPDNILHAIAFELQLDVKPDDTRLKVMNVLQDYLLERHAQNKQVVVFVEEAQSMPIATLEEIRLLSNLETAQNKLLQIVIFGQPELDVMIARQEIRQLKERITYSFYLSPLKQDEVKDYINSRLRSCGYRSIELFEDKAIREIAKYSNGLLRRINILADKSMLASYAANSSMVLAKHVRMAANETEFVANHKLPKFRWEMVFLILVLIIAGTISLGNFNLNSLGIKDQLSSWEVNESIQEDTISLEPIIKPIELKKDIGAEEVEVVEVASTEVKVTIDLAESDMVEERVFPKLGAANPAVSELETAQWQKLEDAVFFYPESYKVENENNVDISASLNKLLKINDLFTSVSGYTNEELIVLKQLTVLPSESVADGLTCERCSTIIYRPIKKLENL